MSIYNAIANSGSNVGAGLNAYAQTKYRIGQDEKANAMVMDERKYQRGRNALADERYNTDRTDKQKRQHFDDAVKMAAGGATDEDLTAWLSQMDPDIEPGIIPSIRSMAPKTKPNDFTLSPGARRFNADGTEIAAAPALPEKPTKPGTPMAVMGDDGKPILVRPEDAVGRIPYEKPTSSLDLTPAEETVDKNFAKDYNEFIAQGGMADIEKQLAQLEGVKEYLEDPATFAATGGVVGLTPKWMRDVLPGLESGAAAQDAVEEVVQRNLRLVLGAQFTEKEGARLIERAYNPRQSEEQNAIRVGRLIEQIRGAAQAKMAAAEYYEQNGTLKGFKGKTQFSMDDFDIEPVARGRIDRSGRVKTVGGATVTFD